jgi:hypothetical protein
VSYVPFLSGWKYRRPITIDNTQNTNNLTDYQVLITVDTASLISAGKMRSDGGDIRFTDSDGITLLSYWVQEGINTSSTKIWVKVPSIPASSTKTIYLYYGNPSATSQSNGSNTFLSFDDFEDGVITDWATSMSGVSISESGGLQKLSLTSNIYNNAAGAYRSTVFNDGIEIIAKAKLVTATTDSGFGLMLRFSDYNNAYWFYWGIYSSGEFRLIKIINGSLTNLATKDGTGKPTLGQFYILHFAVSPNGNLYVNVEGYNTLSATDTARTSGKVGTSIRGASPAEADYDWFFVKKYIPPEPTTSVGSEQLNPAWTWRQEQIDFMGIQTGTQVPFLSGWKYRRPIMIDNSNNTNNLTNYQVLITVDTASLISAGKMRSDGGDIRFTDSDGVTLLNYWVESGINTSSTKIWVKIPSIPASSKKTIYLYYGNPSATSLSNGSNTFDDFDDFLTNTLSNYVQIDSGWSIDTTPPGYLKSPSSGQGFISKAKSLGRNYALRARVYLSSVDSGLGFIWGTAGGSESSVNGYIANYYPSTTISYLRKYVNGSLTNLTGLPANLSGWQLIEFRIDPSKLTVVRSDAYQDAQYTETYFSSLSGIGFRQKSASTYAVDWWALRKYNPPEPTAYILSEQYNPVLYWQQEGIDFMESTKFRP